VRVAHSHNDTTAIDAGAGLHRRAYLWLMRRWIDRYATRQLACSGVQRGLRAPGERHTASFRGERLRARQAKSATRSGDDRHFVPQSEIHCHASYKITEGAI